MVKFDIDVFKFFTRDHFRVLTAIEMGMKNHEIVPTSLIESLSQMKRGNCYKIICDLHKHKTVVHNSKPYDGYTLTFRGYDYLAINTLFKRGMIKAVGRQLGVGKESDVYEAISTETDELCVLKLHRLGRTSFRKVKSKRDYLGKRRHAGWLYLSRLSALKEYAFMKVLFERKFIVPTPIDVSRHALLMTFVPGYTLYHVHKIKKPAILYNKCMQLIVELAENGLVHCDFNEFNLMVDDEYNVTLIDFPQMVSIHHKNGIEYFNRDVQCIRDFFIRKYDYESELYPSIDQSFIDNNVHTHLDTIVGASGFFTPEHNTEYQHLLTEYRLENAAFESKNVDNDETDKKEELSSNKAIVAVITDEIETKSSPNQSKNESSQDDDDSDDSDDTDEDTIESQKKAQWEAKKMAKKLKFQKRRALKRGYIAERQKLTKHLQMDSTVIDDGSYRNHRNTDDLSSVSTEMSIDEIKKRVKKKEKQFEKRQRYKRSRKTGVQNRLEQRTRNELKQTQSSQLWL